MLVVAPSQLANCCRISAVNQVFLSSAIFLVAFERHQSYNFSLHYNFFCHRCLEVGSFSDEHPFLSPVFDGIRINLDPEVACRGPRVLDVGLRSICTITEDYRGHFCLPVPTRQYF